MNGLWKAIVVFWPPLVAAMVWFAAPKQDASAELQRIAVVDRDAIALALANDRGPDGALQAVDGIVERLVADGYIVLDQRYVLRAPAAIVVRP